MRILIATDTLKEQKNGVVRTLKATIKELEKLGHVVGIIDPTSFKYFSLPFYKEIKIPYKLTNLDKLITDFNPDAIHIPVEGRIGLAVRKWCLDNYFPFTTAFHTNFPYYLTKYLHLPENLSFKYFKWFHKHSAAVMVSTNSFKKILEQQNFKNIAMWSRGVDLKQFYPRDTIPNEYKNIQRPIWLNVGRVSVEKNLEALLCLDIYGTVIIVGDGPMLQTYKKKYPKAIFVGAKSGEDLAQLYSMADVFVFPSKSDTFGLVNIEAIASGTPVAAYPVPGPVDIIEQGLSGYCDENITVAMNEAFNLSFDNNISKYADKFTWENATQQFLNNLHPKKIFR